MFQLSFTTCGDVGNQKYQLIKNIYRLGVRKSEKLRVGPQISTAQKMKFSIKEVSKMKYFVLSFVIFRKF